MNQPTIQYKKDIPLDLDQFIELYQTSTLAQRRPVEDREVMRQMMENADDFLSAVCEPVVRQRHSSEDQRNHEPVLVPFPPGCGGWDQRQDRDGEHGQTDSPG